MDGGLSNPSWTLCSKLVARRIYPLGSPLICRLVPIYLKNLDIFYAFLPSSPLIDGNPLGDYSQDFMLLEARNGEIVARMEDQNIASSFNRLRLEERVRRRGSYRSRWWQECGKVVRKYLMKHTHRSESDNISMLKNVE